MAGQARKVVGDLVARPGEAAYPATILGYPATRTLQRALCSRACHRPYPPVLQGTHHCRGGPARAWRLAQPKAPWVPCNGLGYPAARTSQRPLCSRACYRAYHPVLQGSQHCIPGLAHCRGGPAGAGRLAQRKAPWVPCSAHLAAAPVLQGSLQGITHCITGHAHCGAPWPAYPAPCTLQRPWVPCSAHPQTAPQAGQTLHHAPPPRRPYASQRPSEPYPKACTFLGSSYLNHHKGCP